jgi:hypothetical protein
MATIFLDASVLFKAAVTRFLLGAERVGEFRVAWSDAVVDEARRNLVALGREAALAAFEENLVWPREVVLVRADANVQVSLQRTDRCAHSPDRTRAARSIRALHPTSRIRAPNGDGGTRSLVRRVSSSGSLLVEEVPRQLAVASSVIGATKGNYVAESHPSLRAGSRRRDVTAVEQRRQPWP